MGWQFIYFNTSPFTKNVTFNNKQFELLYKNDQMYFICSYCIQEIDVGHWYGFANIGAFHTHCMTPAQKVINAIKSPHKYGKADNISAFRCDYKECRQITEADDLFGWVYRHNNDYDEDYHMKCYAAHAKIQTH